MSGTGLHQHKYCLTQLVELTDRCISPTIQCHALLGLIHYSFWQNGDMDV